MGLEAIVSVDIWDPFRRNSTLAWVAIAGKRKNSVSLCMLMYRIGSWDPGHKDQVQFSSQHEAISSLYLSQCLCLGSICGCT